MISRVVTTCIILSLVTLTRPAEAWTVDPPKACLSAVELRTRLADSEQRIRSVYVDYVIQSYPSSAHALREPPDAYTLRIVTAREPSKCYQLTGHGGEGLEWRDDRFLLEYHVKSGRIVRAEPFHRVYCEWSVSDRLLPSKVRTDFFFVVTGWWPMKGFKPPRLNWEPYMLFEVARSDAHTTVRRFQEKRDGRWCHVLERPQTDALRIDVERGMRGHGPSVVTPKERCIDAGDHAGGPPLVWKRHWGFGRDGEQYDYNAATEKGRRRRVVYGRMTLLQAVVNEVDDKLFGFEPPPGTLKISAETGKSQQTTPGGSDLLQQMAAGLSRNFPGFAEQSKSPSLGILIVPVVVVIASGELWVYLRCSPRNSMCKS